MTKWAGIGLAAVLLLAGCGDDSDTATTGTTTAVPAAGGQSGGAGGTCSPLGAQPVVLAQNNAFDKTCVAVAANRPFTIILDNKDSTAHGFTIAESETATTHLFQQPPVRGPQTVNASVGALRAGTFVFKCQVHPNQMKGTFVVR